MWIIDINGEEPITAQGELDYLTWHQTTSEKYKFGISLCRKKSYQRTDIEDILSRFDQVRPVISHLEVCIPNKPPTPKNIGGGLKVPHRKLWKENLFVKYDKNKIYSLLLDPIPIKSLSEGKKSSVHSFLLILSKVTVMMNRNFFHATVKMGAFILKVLVLINPTFQWHMMTIS